MRKRLAYCFLVTAVVLLCGCAKENAQQGSDRAHEIRIDADVVSTVQTKTTLLTSSNLENYRLHVEAYTAGTDVNYLSSNALVYEGNWVFFKNQYKDYKYYWPDYDLDFFAYSPYLLENTNVQIGTYGAAAPTFSYSGVSEITMQSQADNLLTEFVTAFRTGCNYEDDNPVGLVFHHPFSLVNFRVGESIRCTIVSVTISGISNSGSCVVKPVSPFAQWTPSGAGVDIIADFANDPQYSANGGIRYPEDVNSFSYLSGPYLVVPQSIPDDATIEVKYKALGSQKITTTSSTLKKAILTSSKIAADEWIPGHNYSYSLSLNGAANELFVAVDVTDWVIEGQTDIEII